MVRIGLTSSSPPTRALVRDPPARYRPDALHSSATFSCPFSVGAMTVLWTLHAYTPRRIKRTIDPDSDTDPDPDFPRSARTRTSHRTRTRTPLFAKSKATLAMISRHSHRVRERVPLQWVRVRFWAQPGIVPRAGPQTGSYHHSAVKWQRNDRLGPWPWECEPSSVGAMTVLWIFACVYSTPNHAIHRSRFRYRPRFPALCSYTYTYTYTYTYAASAHLLVLVLILVLVPIPRSRSPGRPRHNPPPFPPSCTGTCTASLCTRTFLGPTRDWVPRAVP